MKKFFYLFILLVSSGLHAQSNFVSTVMDNTNGEFTFLHELPWDQSQLVQIEREVVQLPEYHSIYHLETISNGVSTPFYIPSCADISTEPVFLDDGILATGTTPSNGKECVFFDGVYVIEFDLNLGSGDSNPYLRLVDDRVFIFANDGNTRQLYEYDKAAHTVTKITDSPIDVKNVCATWGTDIFYSTEFVNTPSSQTEYILHKASLINGVYLSYVVHMVNVPFGSLRYLFWEYGHVKFGKLFLSQEDFSYANGVLSNLKIISIDQNDQVEIVQEIVPTEDDGLRLFEWNNDLWSYVSYSNELYKSTDGVSFSLDVDSGLKKIANHYITGNNKLFLKLYDPVMQTHEIAAHYGTIQTIYAGDHLDILMEDNEILYLSDWNWSDSNSIVLIHTAFDGVENIHIGDGNHPPIRNASLMHNGEFTFLFTYGVNDVDVLKLTGSPNAGLNDSQIELSISPNPIGSGNLLTILSKKVGKAKLVNASGRILKQFNIEIGENQLNTSFLSQGVYFLSFMNRTQRIVVN